MSALTRRPLGVVEAMGGAVVSALTRSPVGVVETMRLLLLLPPHAPPLGAAPVTAPPVRAALSAVSLATRDRSVRSHASVHAF